MFVWLVCVFLVGEGLGVCFVTLFVVVGLCWFLCWLVGFVYGGFVWLVLC